MLRDEKTGEVYDAKISIKKSFKKDHHLPVESRVREEINTYFRKVAN